MVALGDDLEYVGAIIDRPIDRHRTREDAAALVLQGADVDAVQPGTCGCSENRRRGEGHRARERDR